MIKKPPMVSDKVIRQVNPDECVCGISDARDMFQAGIDYCYKEMLKQLKSYRDWDTDPERTPEELITVTIPWQALQGLEEG